MYVINYWCSAVAEPQFVIVENRIDVMDRFISIYVSVSI